MVAIATGEFSKEMRLFAAEMRLEVGSRGAFDRLGQPQVVSVPLSALTPGDSPRLAGPDLEHVERLAEIEDPLPPILVGRRTMRVIDGMHRLMAAALRGRQTIEVEFFDGSSAEAFLRAVEENVTHGLPLSQADRRAAVARIIELCPLMSDRAIAKSAGVGTRLVTLVRRELCTDQPRVAARIGRDGRLRPLDSAAGRLRAGAVIAEFPDASLREIARRAGVSPSTASDVRKRLARGEQPVPDRAERHTGGEPDLAAKPVVVPAAAPPDPAAILAKLLRDPSLRHNERGRRLLRVLRDNALGERDWAALKAAVPTHCSPLVFELARRNSQMWFGVAQGLGERTHLPAKHA